jgi:hypothetical protein
MVHLFFGPNMVLLSTSMVGEVSVILFRVHFLLFFERLRLGVERVGYS